MGGNHRNLVSATPAKCDTRAGEARARIAAVDHGQGWERRTAKDRIRHEIPDPAVTFLNNRNINKLAGSGPRLIPKY